MEQAEVSEIQYLSVCIEPDSPEMKAQSVLKPQSLAGRFLTIGRRGTRRYVSGETDSADHLIADPYPYSISRMHCEIERTEEGAIVRDLNSRLGTVVNGKRLSGRHGLESEVAIGRGVHTLVLGRSQGPFRFRLVVAEC